MSSTERWYSRFNNFVDIDIFGHFCIFVDNSCAIQECKGGQFVNSGCREIKERCLQVMELEEASEAKERACLCCAQRGNGDWTTSVLSYLLRY